MHVAMIFLKRGSSIIVHSFAQGPFIPGICTMLACLFMFLRKRSSLSCFYLRFRYDSAQYLSCSAAK